MKNRPCEISGAIGNRRKFRQSVIVSGGLAIAFVFSAGPSFAAVHVEFDTANLIGCRDVTPTDYAKKNPGCRLIEAQFSISSLIRRGSDQDVRQFLYRIVSEEQQMVVADYLPKTHLAASIVGEIAVEKNSDDASSVGGSISAGYNGIPHTKLGGTASASKNNSSHMKIRYQMLPPKELMAASGTIRRHHGVYYKLKPSRQTSLEGAKQFVCIFQVPTKWRAGVVRIRCQAHARPSLSWNPLAGETTCGSGEYLVGLFAQSDETARQTVAHLLVCREEHRRLSMRFRRREANYWTQFEKATTEIGTAVKTYSSDKIRSAMGQEQSRNTSKPPPDRLTLQLRKATSRLHTAELAMRQLKREDSSIRR